LFPLFNQQQFVRRTFSGAASNEKAEGSVVAEADVVDGALEIALQQRRRAAELAGVAPRPQRGRGEGCNEG
jgi:hypothetical protein